MADRREALLAAVKAALEVDSVDLNDEVTTKPANLRVYRHLARGTDQSKLPDLSVRYGGEVPTPLINQPFGVSERDVRVVVRVRVCADQDESADEALIPVMGWAELAALADYSLGGVAANGRPDQIESIDAQEYAETFAAVDMHFVFTIQTKRFDPRQAP